MPVWRKASWRKVADPVDFEAMAAKPLRRNAALAQGFCLAAIASKSTGSATTEAPTVSVDSGGLGKGETKNLQQRFSNLADTKSSH